jgi:hypothetical protein
VEIQQHLILEFQFLSLHSQLQVVQVVMLGLVVVQVILELKEIRVILETQETMAHKETVELVVHAAMVVLLAIQVHKEIPEIQETMEMVELAVLKAMLVMLVHKEILETQETMAHKEMVELVVLKAMLAIQVLQETQVLQVVAVVAAVAAVVVLGTTLYLILTIGHLQNHTAQVDQEELATQEEILEVVAAVVVELVAVLALEHRAIQVHLDLQDQVEILVRVVVEQPLEELVLQAMLAAVAPMEM